MKGKQVIFSKATLKTLVLTSVFILSAVFGPLFLQSKPVEAQADLSGTCKAMISDYASWAQKSPNNVVDSQMSGLSIKTRNPNAQLNFGFGRWAFARLEANGDGLSGNYNVLFSDRMNGNKQHFYWKKADMTGVTISPTSGVTLKLYSWGGNTLKLNDLTCTQDGFIIGHHQGNFDDLIIISLVKTYR